MTNIKRYSQFTHLHLNDSFLDIRKQKCKLSAFQFPKKISHSTILPMSAFRRNEERNSMLVEQYLVYKLHFLFWLSNGN